MSAGDWKEMYKAAGEGDLPLLQHHIRSGVNPNYQHPEILSTPLVHSILKGHTDIALFLLENGADPNLESYFDFLTPLKAAKKMKNKRVIAAVQAKLSQA